MAAYIMVCNVETPPVPPATCAVENITYVPNFWDSGLTMDQLSELIGAVVLLWAIAYVFSRVKTMF